MIEPIEGRDEFWIKSSDGTPVLVTGFALDRVLKEFADRCLQPSRSGPNPDKDAT